MFKYEKKKNTNGIGIEFIMIEYKKSRRNGMYRYSNKFIREREKQQWISIIYAIQLSLNSS